MTTMEHAIKFYAIRSANWIYRLRSSCHLPWNHQDGGEFCPEIWIRSVSSPCSSWLTCAAVGGNLSHYLWTNKERWFSDALTLAPSSALANFSQRPWAWTGDMKMEQIIMKIFSWFSSNLNSKSYYQRPWTLCHEPFLFFSQMNLPWPGISQRSFQSCLGKTEHKLNTFHSFQKVR